MIIPWSQGIIIIFIIFEEYCIFQLAINLPNKYRVLLLAEWLALLINMSPGRVARLILKTCFFILATFNPSQIDIVLISTTTQVLRNGRIWIRKFRFPCKRFHVLSCTINIISDYPTRISSPTANINSASVISFSQKCWKMEGGYNRKMAIKINEMPIITTIIPPIKV